MEVHPMIIAFLVLQGIISMTTTGEATTDTPTLSATFGATHLEVEVVNEPQLTSTMQSEEETTGDGITPEAQRKEQQKEDFCRGGCGGFPGMPGIPGVPGHNGLPGTPGVKGEPGEKGMSGNGGQQGLEGRRGSKGPKGDRGPKGPPGMKGDKGEFGGIKGEKGDTGLPGGQGMKGYRGPRGPPGLQGPPMNELTDELRIAFTVMNATRRPTPHTPLVFQTILSNAGNGYDTETGKFTCKRSGLYAFTFQFFGGYHNFRPEKAMLVKNSEVALTAMSTVDSRLGNFAILQLEESDEIWLEISEERDFGPSNYNSFSGFRLY